jgi:hypothetical protein
MLQLLLLLDRSVRVAATSTTLQMSGKPLVDIKSEGKSQ